MYSSDIERSILWQKTQVYTGRRSKKEQPQDTWTLVMYITAGAWKWAVERQNTSEGVKRPINFHKHGIKYYDYEKS